MTGEILVSNRIYSLRINRDCYNVKEWDDIKKLEYTFSWFDESYRVSTLSINTLTYDIICDELVCVAEMCDGNRIYVEL